VSHPYRTPASRPRRDPKPRSFVALHIFCAVVTAPIWVVPFLCDLYRNPPTRWR
jgi:hypothetical protein